MLKENTSTVNYAPHIISSNIGRAKDSHISKQNFIRLLASDLMQAAIVNFDYPNSSDRKKIHLSIQEDFAFFGDRQLFIYIIFTLLEQALVVHNNNTSSTIHINITTQPSHNIIRFEHHRTPQANQTRTFFFSSFFKSSKPAHAKYDLTFCKRIVDTMGGRLLNPLAEPQNLVTESWQELVIELPQYSSNVILDFKKDILKKKRILIVDDENICRMVTQKYLSEWRCQVDQATDGLEALEKVSHQQYDLILMDIEMPNLQGDAATRRIRSGEGLDPSLTITRDVPIVALSTLPPDMLQELVITSGMNGYIEKPLRKSTIENIIEQYFFSHQSPKARHQTDGIQDKTILIVDDNKINRKIMAIHLENVGAQTLQAKNGKEAMNLLDKNPIDLVLMDIEMPILNGLETTKAIRSGKTLKHFKHHTQLPIIALTGHDDQQTLRKVKTFGMNDHIGKPISADTLIATIATWLKDSPHHGNNTMVSTQSDKERERHWQQIYNLPLLDMAILEHLKDASSESIGDLIELFIQNTQQMIDSLNEAVEENNLARVTHITHSLKGSAGNIGANRLHWISACINDVGLNNQWPQPTDWQHTYDRVFRETQDAFEYYIKTHK